MSECVECGGEVEEGSPVCGPCTNANLVAEYRERGEEVREWSTCPLCDGSGRCFFCAPGGPCYHCSGSGREMPGSADECHICGGLGDVGKGCEMCGYTRRCGHCDGTGRVPASALRGQGPS